MGKFQLNKKGDDPIKIYEDTFKVANSTVETHLGKLGKMPNPIAREYSIHDRNNPNRDLSDPDWISVGADRIEKGRKNTGNRRPWWNNESKASERMSKCPQCDGKGSYEFMHYGQQTCNWCNGTGQLDEDKMDELQRHDDHWNDIARMDNDTNLTTDSDIERWGESKAREVNGKYIVNGMIIGKVTDFEPNNWFGKVELSDMPEFAEYGTLDPQAVVKGDDGVTYTDPKGGSDGSRGTLFNADGSPKPPTVSWGEVEAIAKEAIDENEKDEIFQYLFDLQESGITNMFGSGPYVEREFPHLDKKEVRDVVMEWMSNYEAIHARMGIESRANERSIKQACKNAGVSVSRAEQVAEMNGMDLQEVVDAGNLEEMLEDQRQDDDWYEREARAEFGNESSAGRFLETPQLQQIRNHWDNVMPEEEKRSMLEGMAFLYKSNPTQKFDDLNWEVKESVALSVARLAGVSIDMGTLYGQQYLDDLRSMSWD